ncbi:LysR family transcriptional regulator [Hydrogenophaga sp. ZJX-1]|jgi:DNA-binding transcriptional LysR family regulator|uniref:LysR family transcriptional regulator n=1 Tax=Hydrogenophaga sp. ZJX-1 TaxID=3404778 RepID=UPI003B283D14
MNYSIDDLRAFCAVVRLGRFSEAAQAMHITPSALSRRIASIEREVGGELFERSTRKIVLTPTGATLHEKLLPLIAQMDESLSEASRSLQGRSRGLSVASVATLASSTLPLVAKALFEEFPDLVLSIRDGTASAVTALVEQGAVDFGITTQLTFGSSIHADSLGRYGFNLIVASPEEMLGKNRKSLSWKDIQNLPFVGLNPLSSTRLQIDGALKTLGMSIPWKVEVDQLSTLVTMVRFGGYASIMPTLFDCTQQGVYSVALRQPTLTRELYLIRRSDASISASGSAFIRHVRAFSKGILD